MFNPDAVSNKQAIRRECERVKQLALNLIPEAVQVGLHINVSEVKNRSDGSVKLAWLIPLHALIVVQVVCGDPTCAPIDTVVQLTWAEGLSKPLGIPKTSAEVTQEDLEVKKKS
jgi:hypothetical protein